MQRVVLILTMCLVSFGTYSQMISCNFEQVFIEQAIDSLSMLSGYQFAYNPDILNEKLITVEFQDQQFEKVLAELFAPEYDYKIRGSYVILLPKSESDSPKSKEVISTIKGEIREEGTNKKLENVSIYEVHTLKPVLSDSSGNYALPVMLPDDMAYIAISKANYIDTVIQVKKGENWNVTLRRKSEDVKTKTEKILTKLNNKTVEIHAENVNLTEVRWVQAALTPGLSTNGFLSGQFTNRVSINAIGGYSYALEGVEFGGALNMERSYVKGAQLSGGLNINGDLMRGAQFAGFSNIVFGDVDGLQASGFSNHAAYVGGAQMSGAINTAKNGHGLQATGYANWCSGTFEGLQISGGFNYAKVLKGCQISVVNIADSVSEGIMIGIVNWTKNGLHHFEASYNDITPYNLAFKSGVKHFYTILRAGINPNEAQLWDYGMGLGSMHQIGKRFFWDVETTYHMIQPLDRSPITGTNSQTRLQLRFGYEAKAHFKVIGGPVLHFYSFKPDDVADLSFADRFGTKAFSRSNTAYSVNKAWLGYEFAVRF